MTGTVAHLPEHPGRSARCPFARVFSAVGVSLAMFVLNVPTVMAGHDLIPDRGSQAAPRSLPGSDHFVTRTGAGAQDGSSWQDASSSIESMLNALDPGDTLWIGGGTYSISREISIQRSGAISQPLTISTSSDPAYGGPATIQGANNGYDSMVLLDIDGSHWVIRGESQTNRLTFTSIYLDPGAQHSRGFLMLEGDDFLIENAAFYYPDYQTDNSWQHDRQSGITTGRRDWYASENTSNVEIRHSAFYNLGFGSQDTGRGGALYASNTHNLSFHDNEVYCTFNGIQFEGTNSGWQVYDNVFHDNWNAGISAEQQGASGTGVTAVRIFDNTFYDNYVEAIATWCACGGNASLGWEVFNNLFYRTGDAFSDSQAFFLLAGISDSRFYNNVIIDPFTARWGGTGQAFYVTDNTCGCSENRNNRFLNNTFVNRQHYGSVEFLRIWQSAGRASGNLADSNLLFVGDGSQNSFLNEGSNTFTNNPYFSDTDNPFVDLQHPPSASNRAAAGLMLAPGCRAIDAGSDHSSLFSTDFLGRGRDSAFDIGAYERLPIFADVPFDHPLNREIEALYVAGYTAGCNTDPLLYCPDATMNRAESSVFVERGIHTAAYDPQAPTSQVFADMPLDSWAAKWVNGLWQDQYTAGCGTSPLIYCPWQGHTRAEGSVFYLRMLNGADYQPPQPSQQTFVDVPLDAWYARWVQAAYGAGLIDPCQLSPEMRFCPDGPLTRALAADALARAKGLVNSPPPPTPTPTPGPQPVSCLSQPGPSIILSGSYSSRFDRRDLEPNTRVDARSASFVDADDYPIVLMGGENLCFSGGQIEGTYPTSTSWDRMHSTTAMEVSNQNFTVENTRIHNYGDGVSIKPGVEFFTIRGVHFSYIRDDCVENDWLYPGLVEDALLDGCYSAFSARPEAEGVDGRSNVWTIRNSLIRLQPMEAVYKDRGLIPGHDGWFKWDSSDAHLSPMLSLHDDIFRVDQPANNVGLGVPDGKLASCSNNIVVWLGSGPYPDPLPSCFTISTDLSLWDQAVAAWLARH